MSGDRWLEIECRICRRKAGCFNNTQMEIERICLDCAVFGPDEPFHRAQLEAVKEHPEAYEPGTQGILEAYLRGEIGKWELRQ